MGWFNHQQVYECIRLHYPNNPCIYGICTYIWLIFMVNVGKYTIHGSYGSCFISWIVVFTRNSPNKKWHTQLRCHFLISLQPLQLLTEKSPQFSELQKDGHRKRKGSSSNHQFLRFREGNPLQKMNLFKIARVDELRHVPEVQKFSINLLWLHLNQL